MNRTAVLALILGCACAPPAPYAYAQSAPEAGHGRHMERRFDPERSARSFDNPARDEWQKPDQVLAALNLKSGQAVADIGAGTGYFTVRLAAHEAAPKVYAVDIEAAMVEHIRKRAEKEGLRNVVAVQGSSTSANLPEPVDLVLVVNTYHHIADREGYFRRLRSSMKPGGQLAIVDWKKGAPMGPHREHRFTAAQIKSELEKAGFELAAQHEFLPNQEFLILRIAEAGRESALRNH
jgi:predicted methyltransferase